MRPLLAAMLFGGLATGLVPADDASTGSRRWDFESDSVGSAASGFRTAVGAWSVAMDGSNHVLAQTAKNPDAVFNLIIQPEILYADVALSVRLKAVQGFVDQGGGVVWRAKNARTYYVARFNPLEDSFRVYKVVDGKRSQLGSVKAPGDTNWHALRITMKGSKIECFLDEAIQMTVDDA